MSDPRSLLGRESQRFIQQDGAFERLIRRRDRKRRNQRIAAGVVGIAVFVAAVWIVTSGLSFDRMETPAVPGGAGTGPAVTGPAETRPNEASPGEWDGYGLPPEGTALSTPVEGHPILVQDYEGEELLGEKIVRCPTGCRRWYHTHLVVFADGRVLWWNGLRPGGDYVLERRLTPEGVDLVRSGVEPGVNGGDLPDSAWADARARPYAPPRYSVCFVISRPDGEYVPSATDVVRAMDLLPAAANALLRGNDPDPLHPGCVVVSTPDTRAFSGILSEEGLETGVDGVAEEGTIGVTPGRWVVAAWCRARLWRTARGQSPPPLARRGLALAVLCLARTRGVTSERGMT
jgi:hypothetical protein